MNRLLFLFPLITSLMVTQALVAAPLELDILRQQYEKIHAERVTGPHETALAELNTKFTAALDNTIAQAKSAGDLPTVLALEEDKKRLAAKTGLPIDTEETPVVLKKLRTIYREQLAALEKQRDTSAAELIAPYATRLQELEATLTKSDRIAEAKLVMDYRTGLQANAPTAVAPTTAATPTATAPAPAMPASTAARTPEGDDRKAAEWLIGVGGAVRLSSGGGTYVTKVVDLPSGRFQISAVRFPSPMPPAPDEAFDALSGLLALEQMFAPGGGPQTDEAFRFLATCPQLRYIDLQNWKKMDGRWIDYLSGLEHLEKLFLTSSAKGNLSGLTRLSSNKLIWLHLRSTGTTDETLAVVGGLKNLELLNLRGNPITDSGMASLAGLTRLKTLDVMETSITYGALRTLVGLPLSDLGFGLSKVDFAAATPDLAAAFPKLTGLNLPPGQWAKADFASIGSHWPKIQRLEFSSGSRYDEDAFDGFAEGLPDLERGHFSKSPIIDRHLAGLADLRKLKILDLTETKVTDTALPALQAIRSLKYLDLSRTQVSPTALAEFKKQRPDVDTKP